MVKIDGYEIQHEGQELFWASIADGGWEPNTFKLLKEHIVPNKTFIDIGAWNGVLSLYAAKLGAICHAIEPDPKAFNYLAANVLLNSDIKYNVLIYNIGVSDKIGVTQLNSIGDLGNSMSSLLDRNEGSYCEVETIPLHNFIVEKGINPEDICLLKIDTEGSEIFIIPAAYDFLAKYKPKVHLSLHPFWFPDFVKNVRDIGAVIFLIYDVFDTANGNKISLEDFINEMIKMQGYDVLLIAKQ